MSRQRGLDPFDWDSRRFGPVLARLRAAAFWVAVCLPVAYVPLLATGLDTTEHQLLLVGFLSLNVIVVVLGHRYRTE